MTFLVATKPFRETQFMAKENLLVYDLTRQVQNALPKTAYLGTVLSYNEIDNLYHYYI